MKKSALKKKSNIFLAILLFLTVNYLSPTAAAQKPEEEPPPDLAPPALKLLTKEEQKTLDALSDAKRRVKISLELMDARLLKAEKYKTEESFKDTLVELAGFHALLDNTMNFLVKNNTDGDRVDKRFITFEIYLRKQIPRLEVIRREIPSRYGYHVGKLMVAVREARAKAVEPIFSDTVVPVSKKPDEN